MLVHTRRGGRGGQRQPKGSDTLESFLLKITFESNLRKKLARIEHVLIVTVYFERRKIAKVFMTHVQDFFQKSLLKATFERKISSVSLPLRWMMQTKGTPAGQIKGSSCVKSQTYQGAATKYE